MPAWQPTFFPEVTFPVRNSGTDDCILTCITFECLGVSEEAPAPDAPEMPPEKRRDLGYAIIIDLENSAQPQSFPVTFRIPPGETLKVHIAVGAKRTVEARFVLRFHYDRRGKTTSDEVKLNITNHGGVERCYQPGIALERFAYFHAKGPRDLESHTGIKPTDMIRSLYRQNRPLNVDYLRFGGPGAAYFFKDGRGPILPGTGDAAIRLEHSTDPTFYVAMGPAYGVRQLKKEEALQLVHDPRLAPPVAGTASAPALYGLNEYGACSVADTSQGVAITQILPGCSLTAINTEIFTEKSASRFVGPIKRGKLILIPWGEIHQLAISLVNRFFEVLSESCDLHDPIFIRAGLINVKGLTLAHIDDSTTVFQGQLVARGPLRREQYVFVDILDIPDPYPNGLHVLSDWSEMIAGDTQSSLFPRILSLDGKNDHDDC